MTWKSEVRKFGVVVALIALAAGGWIYWQSKWVNYSSQVGRFEVEYPRGWSMKEYMFESGFDVRVEFSPTSESNRISREGQISVTMVGKPLAGQVLGSEDEFKLWLDRSDGATASGMKKLGNRLANNIKGVMLAEQLEDYWAITSWFAKDGKNYYLAVLGNGDYTDKEIKIMDKVVKSFRLK